MRLPTRFPISPELLNSLTLVLLTLLMLMMAAMAVDAGLWMAGVSYAGAILWSGALGCVLTLKALSTLVDGRELELKPPLRVTIDGLVLLMVAPATAVGVFACTMWLLRSVY